MTSIQFCDPPGLPPIPDESPTNSNDSKSFELQKVEVKFCKSTSSHGRIVDIEEKDILSAAALLHADNIGVHLASSLTTMFKESANTVLLVLSADDAKKHCLRNWISNKDSFVGTYLAGLSKGHPTGIQSYYSHTIQYPHRDESRSFISAARKRNTELSEFFQKHGECLDPKTIDDQLIGAEHRLVGCLTYTTTTDNHGRRIIHVDLVSVRTCYQKIGLGRYLMLHVYDEMMSSEEYHNVNLQSVAQAGRFYAKLGYKLNTDGLMYLHRYKETRMGEYKAANSSSIESLSSSASNTPTSSSAIEMKQIDFSKELLCDSNNAFWSPFSGNSCKDDKKEKKMILPGIETETLLHDAAVLLDRHSDEKHEWSLVRCYQNMLGARTTTVVALSSKEEAKKRYLANWKQQNGPCDAEHHMALKKFFSSMKRNIRYELDPKRQRVAKTLEAHLYALDERNARLNGFFLNNIEIRAEDIPDKFIGTEHRLIACITHQLMSTGAKAMFISKFVTRQGIKHVDVAKPMMKHIIDLAGKSEYKVIHLPNVSADLSECYKKMGFTRASGEGEFQLNVGDQMNGKRKRKFGDHHSTSPGDSDEEASYKRRKSDKNNNIYRYYSTDD